MLREWLPSWLTFVCTFFIWAIPFSIQKINKKIHQIGDPVWKQNEASNQNRDNPPQFKP